MLSSELRYFLAVATTGSLSAASQQLFVAVSAISRQVQRLEERMGVLLFERHARGMILTDAGRILENHVRKSMMDLDAAVAEIQGLSAQRKTLISVGCTEGMAFDALPNLFAQFQQSHPETAFYLKVGSAQQVSQMVRHGEVDVALQFAFAPEHGVEVLLSLPAPLLLLMAEDHPLAGNTIMLADLAAYPLALPEPTTTLRQLFDLSCRMQGAYLEPTLCCSNFTTLYHYVLSTPQAVTACSFYSVMYKCRQAPLRLATLAMRQLEQRALQVQIQSGHTLTGVQQAFIAMMQDAFYDAERYCNTLFETDKSLT
ncbi:LysR family transcriptional regulator [Candidatus Symbiopectobacterium sp. NZEC127]|uniref:LysR family transcriptional regulator n=1 Tax=Candidatus Symbiopectobacterium sp. NZEC127 TaxID=2820472 RepID=UPI0022278ACD|nr:LysR family transcriptional regulator [Candidatus Symbiopectobacterium sp. NZEC127]MCW2485265.1 LysR family transcriptional regulator [Candidatus Symbiopectobacterium sp. NZEC127]